MKVKYELGNIGNWKSQFSFEKHTCSIKEEKTHDLEENGGWGRGGGFMPLL